MKLTITIDMDNAAFFDDDRDDSQPRRGYEAARVLNALAERLASCDDLEDGDTFPLRDTNGNRVGQAHVTDDATATPNRAR